jgi:hypothetical protein
VVEELPDWHHRIRFWLDVAHSAGGYVSILAAIITSPYFSPGLAVAGLGWLLLVGEPTRGIQRQRWLPLAGWTIVAVCLTATAITLGQGYFEVRVREVAVALTSSERHLSPSQATRLSAALKPHASEFGSVVITVLAADSPEPSGYAAEIMSALVSAGVSVQSTTPGLFAPIPMRAIGTGVKGVFIQVKDVNNPPKLATILEEGLRQADIQVSYWRNLNFGDNNFAITVGLQ